ncbi:MAG: phosphodiesterase [Actinobacteria bacterium]|nr:MAG: phosphodiesterase [Actinomycetota bacterium]
MPKPPLIVQLSDIHIGGSEDGKDPMPRVEAVIEAVRSLPNAPDAVLVSGDLTDHGTAKEYEVIRAMLGRLELPLYVLPGNHDDRGRLRATFDLPGEGEEPIRYSVDVGELRVVLLDSNVPGRDPGAYDDERLSWLDAELAAEPERPTLLAVHHTPLATGILEWDAINLEVRDREALGAVVARHPQLRAIVGGHLHRVAVSALGGCPVLSAPSAYLQVRPNFERDEVTWIDPPGFAIHALRDGELTSQVESVPFT